jgi:hypothetical protein
VAIRPRGPGAASRKAQSYSGSGDTGGDEVSTTLVPVFAAELLLQGEGPEDDYYLKVLSAEAEQSGSPLAFTVGVNDPTAPPSI